MLADLRELWKFRDLVWSLVVRDLTIRYKNSVLGFFWSLANPLVQVATITVIFKYILQIRIPNYSAYVLCAFLPWMFFQMTLSDAGESVLRHHDLLKKVYFPREVLPISVVLSNLVHLVLAFGVFFVYLLWLGVKVQPGWALLPLVVLVQVLLMLGLSFFVSALSVFYEDIRYLVGVGTSLFFYFCPIIYLSEQILFSQRIPAHLRSRIWEVYHWNPVATLIETYRQLLIPPFSGAGFPDVPVSARFLAIAVIISCLCATAGYAYFNARKWQFAERP